MTYLKSKDAAGNRKCMRCGGVLDAQLRCSWQGCSNSAHGIDRDRRLALALGHARKALAFFGWPAAKSDGKRAVLGVFEAALQSAHTRCLEFDTTVLAAAESAIQPDELCTLGSDGQFRKAEPAIVGVEPAQALPPGWCAAVPDGFGHVSGAAVWPSCNEQTWWFARKQHNDGLTRFYADGCTPTMLQAMAAALGYDTWLCRGLWKYRDVCTGLSSNLEYDTEQYAAMAACQHHAFLQEHGKP